MTREEYLHAQLAYHRQKYAEAVQPIIEELARLESIKPPRPIFIPTDLLNEIDRAIPFDRELIKGKVMDTP